MRARATHHSAWFVLSLSPSLYVFLSLSFYHNNRERLKRLIHFVIAITVCVSDMFTSIIAVVGL